MKQKIQDWIFKLFEDDIMAMTDEIVQLEKEFSTGIKLSYDLIFSMAMSLGVTPSKLAKNLNPDKLVGYVKEFELELEKQDKKEKEARKKAIKKGIQKAKSVV